MIIARVFFISVCCALLFTVPAHAADPPQTHIRANQVGYLTDEAKVAIAFAERPLAGEFQVIDAATQQTVHTGSLQPVSAKPWGKFQHYYELDFTSFKKPGRYLIQLADGTKSREFSLRDDSYENYQDDLLVFMRQQRCGYNPYLDMVCHKRDGRTAYGPLPAGSFVDASGGWHDAGDQLKYLITSSNATARMLLAYELAPEKFGDRVDELGRPLPNGIADVLDEARWGLDWLHKMHPHPTHLYHQVADDRDHTGWKYPDKDDSDYGWGPNSYRVVYFADGKPQGLSKHQSEATGVANLAGRCAAAMAMASRIWREDVGDPVFADKCLRAAKELYQLGKQSEGYQQGNSFKAKYRYEENTWADDMEWGAAELFKTTGEQTYLDDAVRYAELIGATSWMPHDKVGHYEFYPFLNVGHFALYPHADAETQKKLAGYYRAGIEACIERSKRNPFGVGVPFVWCSNNLTAALITQILLYEQMTGDTQYHTFMLAQRDWLFGRNPWGTTMFTGIPRSGEYPEDVHTGVWKLSRQMVPGGLVDGPVYTSVYESLLGLHLTQDDEFADFQNEHVVYHDDIGDYSTNEPTMDGTADAITMLAHFGAADLTAPALNKRGSSRTNGHSEASPASRRILVHPSHAPDDEHARNPDPSVGRTSLRMTGGNALTITHGGIIRGPQDQKQLALIFTGGDYGEGTETILDTLKQHNLQGAFFVTGAYLAQPAHKPLLKRIVAEGHLLGPHSHGHLLYASWEDRNQSLVTEEQFKADLQKNLDEIAAYTGTQAGPIYFVPPFEWFNSQHVAWAKDLGCVLVNFTPGTRSNRDYAPEGDKAFKPSTEIIADILAHEVKDPQGLNGHLLLLHLGSQRQDKFPPHLGELIDELTRRGYKIVRVDELLSK
jgi:peptidoglycan/xylan/chitin deacetylase (PgdA/CDA1 family)